MEHIGRVRRSKTTPKKKRAPGAAQKRGRGAGAQQKDQRVATTSGYVDIWAGLVLKGKQFLPLARQLFSSRHPQCTSQNAVEEAVLAQALALLQRVGLAAIVLGDKGLGRKELIIRLANRDQAAVLRVDADITVFLPDAPDGLLLADAVAQQPWRGEVDWDQGERGRLRCRLRRQPAGSRTWRRRTRAMSVCTSTRAARPSARCPASRRRSRRPRSRNIRMTSVGGFHMSARIPLRRTAFHRVVKNARSHTISVVFSPANSIPRKAPTAMAQRRTPSMTHAGTSCSAQTRTVVIHVTVASASRVAAPARFPRADGQRCHVVEWWRRRR